MHVIKFDKRLCYTERFYVRVCVCMRCSVLDVIVLIFPTHVVLHQNAQVKCLPSRLRSFTQRQQKNANIRQAWSCPYNATAMLRCPLISLPCVCPFGFSFPPCRGALATVDCWSRTGGCCFHYWRPTSSSPASVHFALHDADRVRFCSLGTWRLRHCVGTGGCASAGADAAPAPAYFRRCSS